MITCCPSASPSAGAIVRAVMSTFPLGGQGTTIRTGWFGKSCAEAAVDASARTRTNRLNMRPPESDATAGTIPRYGTAVNTLTLLAYASDPSGPHFDGASSSAKQRRHDPG